MGAGWAGIGDDLGDMCRKLPLFVIACKNYAEFLHVEAAKLQIEAKRSSSSG